MNPEAPEKPGIDWSDPEARAAHLKEIVEDARQKLSLVECAGMTPAAAFQGTQVLSPLLQG